MPLEENIQFINAVQRHNKLILNDLKKSGIITWIAGGAIRDYFMGIPIRTDYDLFFPDNENYNKCLEFFKSKNAFINYESDNGTKLIFNNKTYDLVKKFFNNPQETIDAFDFTVSMFAVDSQKVYYGPTSFIDLAKKQLMINKITYPASTLSRAFKYYEKGFRMCKGEMYKLCKAIQNMQDKPVKINEPQTESNDSTSADFGLGDFFIGID